MHRLLALIKTGTDVLQENRKRTTVVIVNVMAIIPALLAIIMGPILFALTGNWQAWLYPWIEGAVLTLAVVLNKRQQYNRAALLTFLVHSFGLFFFGLFLGKAACIEGIVIFMIGFSFLLFERRKEQILSISFLLCIALLLELNGLYKVVDHLPYPERAGTLMYIIIFFLVTFLNIMVLRFYSQDFSEWIKRLEIKSVSKSNFIAKTSHDLRGSINVIESILEDWFDPAHSDPGKEITVQYDQVSNMYFATQDVKLVMNDVLSLSKIESGSYDDITRSSVKIRDWFAKRTAGYQVLGNRKAVRITCRIDDDVPEHIMTDSAKLHRIVINLLTNAIKFTRNETTVRLHVYLLSGMTFCVDIADEGVGIEEKNIEKIFNPYISQMNQQTEATGLGLTISRHFANRMGGNITVKSLPGKGSTFTLTLPLEQGISSQAKTLPAVQQRTNGHEHLLPFHVLVVDDDIMCRTIAERLLRKMVQSVMVADSLDNGLWLANEQPPNLILLDLNMPGISGKDMLYKIKHHPLLSHVPVIICSADAYEETIADMKTLGADGYVVKPITSSSDLYNEIVKFSPAVAN
jgi:signal transduction histidine kinase